MKGLEQYLTEEGKKQFRELYKASCLGIEVGDPSPTAIKIQYEIGGAIAVITLGDWIGDEDESS